MSEFKVGDRVADIDTGDEGVISKPYKKHGYWCVLWENGSNVGYEVYTPSNFLVHISESQAKNVTFDRLCQLADSMGYVLVKKR